MQTEIEQPATTVAASSKQEPNTPSASISATAPGQVRVIKRNGTVVPYDDSKISVAITKGFLAVEGGTDPLHPGRTRLHGRRDHDIVRSRNEVVPVGAVEHGAPIGACPLRCLSHSLYLLARCPVQRLDV